MGWFMRWRWDKPARVAYICDPNQLQRELDAERAVNASLHNTIAVLDAEADELRAVIDSKNAELEARRREIADLASTADAKCANLENAGHEIDRLRTVTDSLRAESAAWKAKADEFGAALEDAQADARNGWLAFNRLLSLVNGAVHQAKTERETLTLAETK